MIQTLFGSLDEEKKPSFIERMKEAVSRTRENLAERIEDVVSIGKEIDRSTLDDLEATLIGADLGTTTTHEVLEKLREKADRKQIKRRKRTQTAAERRAARYSDGDRFPHPSPKWKARRK